MELALELGIWWLNPSFTADDNSNSNKISSSEILAALPGNVKKYKTVGYNKAALAFIEVGRHNTKNPRPSGGRYNCDFCG